MHTSVLLDEVINYLDLKETDIVVDMTLGYGGHSSEILKRIPKGYLYAFDQDQEAINNSKEKLKNFNNYKIIKSNFRYIKNELDIKVDKVLFDLGVSSPQLDQYERGFSFHKDAVLDMRMDQTNKLDAKYVVNNYSFQDLVKLMTIYGEEKYAKNIARNIERYRETKEITNTLELVDIIKDSVPFSYKKDKHPARKVFQAIRIEVNDELNSFKEALNDSLDMLNVGGRVAVITFHSLEDKICKNIFKERSSVAKELSKLPVIPDNLLPSYKLVCNISPSDEEININNRARSSRLRVIERIK